MIRSMKQIEQERAQEEEEEGKVIFSSYIREEVIEENFFCYLNQWKVNIVIRLLIIDHWK